MQNMKLTQREEAVRRLIANRHDPVDVARNPRAPFEKFNTIMMEGILAEVAIELSLGGSPLRKRSLRSVRRGTEAQIRKEISDVMRREPQVFDKKKDLNAKKVLVYPKFVETLWAAGAMVAYDQVFSRFIENLSQNQTFVKLAKIGGDAVLVGGAALLFWKFGRSMVAFVENIDRDWLTIENSVADAAFKSFGATPSTNDVVKVTAKIFEWGRLDENTNRGNSQEIK